MRNGSVISAYTKVGFILTTTLLAAAVQAETRYTLKELGVFDATDLNDNGEIIGRDGKGIAYLLDAKGTRLVNLTTLLAPYYVPTGYSVSAYPTRLNNKGQIIGHTDYVGECPWDYCDSTTDGFLYDRSTGNADQLGIDHYPKDINEKGQVLINIADYYGFHGAELYDNGSRTQIDPGFGVFGRGMGLALTGAVVGFNYADSSSQGPDTSVGYQWKSGSTSKLSSATYKNQQPFDINDSNQIVGSTKGKAFLYHRTTGYNVFGSIYSGWSEATSINNAGVVVGSTNFNKQKTDKAFVYSNGKMSDLNGLVNSKPATLTLNHAVDINAKGQILATSKTAGVDGLDIVKSYLLTPVPDAAVQPYKETRIISGDRGTWKRGNVVVPTGATRLVVYVEGGVGETDLYLGKGYRPDLTHFDCKRTTAIANTDNKKQCYISNPAPGTWYFGVYGRQAYSNVRLDVSYR